MYYVYVLRSLDDGLHYIGYTSNINKRLSEHNCGFSRYTKKNSHWEIVYLERYFIKSDAIKREKQIKSYKGGNAFKKLFNKHVSQDTQAVNEGSL